MSQASIIFTELPRDLNSSPLIKDNPFLLSNSPSFSRAVPLQECHIYISRNIRSQGLVTTPAAPSIWVDPPGGGQDYGHCGERVGRGWSIWFGLSELLGLWDQKFSLSGHSLHFKIFLTLVNKKTYVSKTMEFELELVFFDVLLILLACFFVEWMHSWLLLSTFCTNLFRCDQVKAELRQINQLSARSRWHTFLDSLFNFYWGRGHPNR